MSTPNGSTAQVVPTDFTRQELLLVFKPWLEMSADVALFTLHELVVTELFDRGHEEIGVEIGGEE